VTQRTLHTQQAEIRAKEDEMGGTFSTGGDRRGTYRGSVGTFEETRHLGRPSHRWKDNIKMDLKKQFVRVH
jgi:hypothetical protein